MSILRQAAVNASWLVSAQMVRLALNFITGVLIARHYGPAGLGLYSYGQVLVQMLMPIATLGMPEIVVREFSSGKRDPDMVLATALGVRVLLSLVALVLIVVLALVLRSFNWAVLTVVFGYGLSFIPQSIDVVESRFQSLNRVGALSTLRMINGIGFTLLRVGALVLSPPIELFAYLYSAEILGFALLTLLTARRQGIRILPRRANRNEAELLVRSSVPLMIRLIAVAIYMRIDQVMIERFLGEKEMGIYSAAVRITELWYFLPVAIVAGAAPNLTRYFHDDPPAYGRSLQQLMRILVLLATVPAAIFTLGASTIIHLLFGPEYAAAAPVLAIQCWAGIFAVLGVAASPWFVNSGMLRFAVYQAIVGAIVSAGMNAVLIPRFGMVGAASTVIISYAVSGFLMNAIFPQTRSLFFMQVKAFLPR